MSGGFWSLLTVLGPLLLGGAILWALLRNRQTSRNDLDRTEHATRERILEQDALDKQRDTDTRT